MQNMTSESLKREESELEDELNLWEISAQLKAIKERLTLIKVESKEFAALRTGVTVAQSAVEDLLK